MTTTQIAQTLTNKGFSVSVEKNGKLVYISLNRQINTMEVKIALDYPDNLIGKSGKKVVVVGQ